MSSSRNILSAIEYFLFLAVPVAGILYVRCQLRWGNAQIESKLNCEGNLCVFHTIIFKLWVERLSLLGQPRDSMLERNIESISAKKSVCKIIGAWRYYNLPSLFINGFLLDNQNIWKSFTKNSALSQTDMTGRMFS